MKDVACTVCGVFGSAIAYLFGGWDNALICLVIFMCLDIVTGLIVALIFHNSPKNANGKIESRQFLKGVFKKFGMICLICTAHLLDNVLEVNFIKTATTIAFIVNEVISITENTALMGIPMPEPILNALEILTKKEEQK